ncbi:MexH family multidrug efflux RND transporter periplasmic adaptor subunit [Salinimicrobium marinum]|uniref:MexH family multidrug efflux RND transporter periplasmic adaptor subunit n=1 Tax=Salinimicrobium marinum TaxID=680283 RepID=A0A918S6K3_9FLAO|nr:efflux RND transporter periplasmic adaptor subunit [Salinimicrobium marinum]GHA27086.1 MexH family multidrug efflux RND transporter periplasmic adaptor subunit [Salinimicrobium marinum]
MKTKHIFYALLVLGLGALISYRIIENTSARANNKPQEAQTSATVKGEVLEPQKFSESLSLSGSLEANEQVELRSEVSGVVENISFQEGSKVSQGQVLVRVNDLELRAQLAKIKTAEKLASENERRAQLLLEKEAISQEEYDMARADLQSAEAESQLIAAQLAKAAIKAPFSGTIGLREISEGTYVTPSSLIAKLVNTDKLKLTFAIPEKYSNQVGVGSQLSFTTAGSPEEHTATIYAIEPGVDVATRTLKMRAIAENKEGKLIPGTFANVLLPLATVDDAIMVPTEALIPIQNGKKIYVVQNGIAREVIVQTGSRTEDSVRVLSGLKPGDTILTSGVMILKDGVPVNVSVQEPVANNKA